MAQHLLDRAQIGAVVEQVAGEGMAQHMRRNSGRVDAGLARQFLQQLADPVAGQMAARAARGEQPARVPAPAEKPLAHANKLGDDGARRLAQRHQALARALAPHDQDHRVPCHGVQGQAHQLGDPHPGGVEQLEQRQQSHALRAPARSRGLQQEIDLGLGEQLRQAASAPRCVQAGGGIVAAQAFGEQESVELADRGEAPGRRARRAPRRGQCRHIGAQILAFRARQFSVPAGEKPAAVAQVAQIGVEGILGRAPFGGQHLEECL